MIKIFAAALFLASNALEANQEWRDAYDLYKIEAQDYISTMRVSEKEFRKIRQISLRSQYESKLNRLEDQLLASNESIIAEIEGYIKKHGIYSLDDLLLIRLSNLHHKRAQYIWTKKQKEYAAQLKRFYAGIVKIEPKPPKANFQRAIYYGAQLLKLYPDSPIVDQAHYMIATSFEDMGQKDKAIALYKRFLKYTPGSSLSDEVMWRLAEHHFEKGKLKKAAYLYDRISSISDSRFRNKANYKLAASYYQAGNFPKAAEYFEKIYRETNEATFVTGENLTFYQDSLEYLGIIFLKGIKIKIDLKGLSDAVFSATEILRREAREKEARVVLMNFLKKYPMTPNLPQFAKSVIESFVNEDQYDKANVERLRFIQVLTKNSLWWNTNRSEKRAQFYAQDFLETELLASAKYLVDKGIEESDKSFFIRARESYLSFLKNFSFSDKALQARFELAQVEYQLGNYKEASYHFRMVADNKIRTVFSKESAYGYLWSEAKGVDFIINDTQGVNLSKTPQDARTGKQKLSHSEKVFLRAAKYYVEKFPTGERAQKILFKVAELYYKRNRFKLAEIANRRIVADRDNASLITLKALILSGQINNILGRWNKVNDRFEQMDSLSLAQNFETRSDFSQSVTSNLDWKSAVELEDSGRLLEAARKYESLGFRNQDSNFVDEAYWRAAVLFRQSGQIKKSNENLTRIRDSEYFEKVEFMRATNFQRMLKYKLAAEKFESFAKKYKKSALSGEALLSAALLYRDMGQSKVSAKIFSNYAKRNQNRLVWYVALRIFAEIGDVESIKRYQGEVSGFGNESYLRVNHFLAVAHHNSGNLVRSKQICSKVLPQIERVSKSSWTASLERAHFECSYYTAKSEEEVQEAIARFSKRRHFDLVAQIYNDLGDRALKEKRFEDAAEQYLASWKVSSENLFKRQGYRAYNGLLSLGKEVPFHKAAMIDWNVVRDYSVNWKRPEKEIEKWELAVSDCENGNYRSCIRNLKSLDQKDSGILQSLFKANLLAGFDIEAKNALKAWGNRVSWSEEVVWISNITKFMDVIPEAIQPVSAQNASGTNESFVRTALGYRSLSKGKLKEGYTFFEKAIELDPQNHSAYVGVSELLIRSGKARLASKALLEGVRNTRDQKGLKALSVMISSFSDKVLYGTSQFGEDQRLIYAKGFNDLIQNREKRSRQFFKKLKNGNAWKMNSSLLLAKYGNKKDKVRFTAGLSSHSDFLNAMMGGQNIDKWEKKSSYNPLLALGAQRLARDVATDSEKSDKKEVGK